MLKIRQIITLLLVLSTLPISTYASNVKNSFLFIENNVDQEYFITTSSLDPRFSGANVMTKYSAGRGKQESIGYMGYTGGYSEGYYEDIWLENSPINKPFDGARCRARNNTCPRDGVLRADLLKSDGAYHIEIIPGSNKDAGEVGYARGIFSSSFYEYYKNFNVGITQTLYFRACGTKTNYDMSSQTCASVGGKIVSHDFTITKDAHLKLKSTNALQEIFVDSEGRPVLGLGSRFCEIGSVGKADGIICQLVELDFEGDISSGYTLTYISLNLKPIAGLKPANDSIKIAGHNSTTWYNYGSNNRLDRIISPSTKGIDIFLSNAFLKELIVNNIDLSQSQDFFTFAINNTRLPQSGFYEFTPSNTIIIKPRDYGISIVSKDLVSKPYREGKVGDKEPPLLFDYTVTTSAFRQADKITASVEGPTQMIRGIPYCIFASKDKKMHVPFSAYLSYTNERGQKISARSACNNAPVDLKDALWTQTTWPYPYQLDGFFYRTDLQLSFPMNEGTSLYSLEGEDWLGVVEASGYVNVFAEWTGPDIH